MKIYSPSRQIKWGILTGILIIILELLFDPSILHAREKDQKALPRKDMPQKDTVQKEGHFCDLDQLIEEARNNNPSIKAAYNTYRAAQERIAQAIALEDPHATYGYFFERAETRVGPQIAKYGISQKFPFFTELTLKGKIAAKDSEIAYQNYSAVEREVIRELKYTFFDLYWMRKSIEITIEIKDLLDTLEKVAESKYSTGIASQQDVMKAHVEISKLIAKLLVLDEHEVTLIEKLNTLLNRPVETPVGRIKDFELTPFEYTLGELVNLAEENRQELKAALLNIDKHKEKVSLRKLDYFPDFTIGVDFIDVGSGRTRTGDDGKDAWMGMIKINIPVWLSRITAGVKEAKSELVSSRDTYEDVRNYVYFQLKDFIFQAKTSWELVDLYKSTLIPQAEESLKTSEASYGTGETDFLDIIDSERILLNFTVAYFGAIADYGKAIADLERAVGVRVEDFKK